MANETPVSGNPLLDLSDERQRTVRQGFPFGEGPSGQMDGQSVQDVREGLRADEQARLERELEDRKKQIVRIERQLEIGPLYAPANESFGGYRALHDFGLKNGSGSFPIQFNPFQFGIFDGKICEKFEGDDFPHGELSNIEHAEYNKHNELRRNIAILRNYLYVQCFGADGYQSFMPKDVANRKHIEDMAECIGTGLKNSLSSNPLRNMMTPLDIEEASKPDSGVAYMYNYLLKLQQNKTTFTSNLNPLNWSTMPNQDWELKPIEETAFAPVYMTMDKLKLEPIIDLTPDSVGEKLANFGVQMDYSLAQLRVPEQLSKPVKDDAIYLAKKILDNFRIIGGNNPQNANLAVNEADELQQVERIYDISLIYKDKFCELARADRSQLNNPTFALANDAIAKLTYMIKLQALEELQKEGNQAAGQIMAELMDRVPENHRPLPGENFTTLINRLQAGLEEVIRIKGLPPLSFARGVSRQNVISAQHEKANIDRQGHMDVATLLQQSADKDTINRAKMTGANPEIVASSVRTSEGKKVLTEIQELQKRQTEARIAAANDPNAIALAEKMHQDQEAARRAQIEAREHLESRNLS